MTEFKTAEQLLSPFGFELTPAQAATDIQSLTLDSREVAAGSLFFAYPGAATDGRNYMQAALQAGVALVICEAQDSDTFIQSIELSEAKQKIVLANGVRDLVGKVANEFYGRPSESLQVFGITGTNGKTTCCYLLAQALKQLGLKTAVIGTLGAGQIDDLQNTANTTPDAITLHRLLAGFVKNEVTQVCMEVSSHAIDQSRISGIQFFYLGFTNLSHDHLDYHGDMASYAAVKRALFTDFASELVVTNADDDLGEQIIEAANAEFVASYGSDNADVVVEESRATLSGIELEIDANGLELNLATPLVGLVNVPNIALVVTTLLALSVSVEEITEIVAQLKPAPGRMELLKNQRSPAVVIDYAHTPDALEQALRSIDAHCNGELWCVFGCGGDRDTVKRAVMGEVANKWADKVIVTNDNPRSESPQQIADQILIGAPRAKVVLDRAAAIAEAVQNATNNDWVLIAGKGHENYQEIDGQCLEFSDREQVIKSLEVAA